jgi:hypothetical protein
VLVTVTSNRRGHATAQLLHGSRRVAHAAGAVPGRLRLAPAHPLEPGAYVVRIKVNAGGSSVSSTRVLRIR